MCGDGMRTSPIFRFSVSPFCVMRQDVVIIKGLWVRGTSMRAVEGVGDRGVSQSRGRIGGRKRCVCCCDTGKGDMGRRIMTRGVSWDSEVAVGNRLVVVYTYLVVYLVG